MHEEFKLMLARYREIERENSYDSKNMRTILTNTMVELSNQFPGCDLGQLLFRNLHPAPWRAGWLPNKNFFCRVVILIGPRACGLG